ncbi:hypothetical protein ACUZ9N_01840 [Mycoplasmopsis gallinarum]
MNKIKKLVKLSSIIPLTFSPILIAASCNEKTRKEKETELTNLYDQYMNQVLAFIPLLGNNAQSIFNSLGALNNKETFVKEIAELDDEKLDVLIKVLKNAKAALKGEEIATPVLVNEKQEELASLIDQFVNKLKTEINNMPETLRETLNLSMKNFVFIKSIIPLMKDEQIDAIIPMLKQQLSLYERN